MAVETVKSNVDAPETSLACRILKVAATNKRAPKYRAEVALSGPMRGLVLEFPIFQSEEDGSYSVSMPGGTFKSLKPAQMTMEHGGKVWVLSDPDPAGVEKFDKIGPAILTALHAYLGTQNAEQRITL